ncbi:PEP-CTERM sorting domain-containing protein [Nitrosovibrio sp. Nv17]|uniref:Npun_F0296 family exosortase-dependent surface protein n=1 Tax=Nitrosovibrio sp. Nv17 TaxID=1855339 RepID=UPI0015A52764|nr:PEP-CTERM sorting domain-containing protein [Nitrosovibrio sp. Nv17]
MISVHTASTLLALGIAIAAPAGMAAATLTASVGGTPAGGAVYESFDTLAATGGVTDSGITVSFSGTGARTVDLPNLAGYYAAPYISNGNGALFDNFQADGPNATQYLTTGIGQVTLDLGGHHQYFGLLWGSVDNYNTLSFYDGTTLLFSFSGLDVDSAASGNQGAAGTFYVNIDSTIPFDRVVASSTQYGFEFDNVSLAVNPSNPGGVLPIPEPETYAMLLAGLAMVGAIVRRRTLAISA